MGLLDYIYSRSDAAKRAVKGLLADPIGSFQQTAGQLTDDAKAMSARNARMIADPASITSQDTNAVMGLLWPAPMGITVWHGSPHKFTKFDMSKIGTGEGAQAYGHGLYMAENPSVANEYAAKLGKPEVLFNGKRVDQLNVSEEAKNLAKWIESRGGAMSYGAQGRTVRDDFSRLPEKIQKELGSVDLFDGGNLYKVDIPDEAVARMLDWDKKLSEQAPEVRQAIESHQAYPAIKSWLDRALSNAPPNTEATGQAINEVLASKLGGQQAVSDLLRKQGIPGIRYLDGGSRSAGQGSSNFVLFSDDLPRILEINGQATGQVPWKPKEWQGLLGGQ